MYVKSGIDCFIRIFERPMTLIEVADADADAD